MTRTEIASIAAARARDFMLCLEIYCQAPDCPARETTIRVKDHDHALLALVRRRGLPCPLCGSPRVTLHHVLTRAEQERDAEQLARESVNTQMYERDHGSGFAPVSVLIRDDLPHTPPGWWDK